jgi:hypothetical protein
VWERPGCALLHSRQREADLPHGVEVEVFLGIGHDIIRPHEAPPKQRLDRTHVDRYGGCCQLHFRRQNNFAGQPSAHDFTDCQAIFVALHLFLVGADHLLTQSVRLFLVGLQG